jgi:hypothetical protein
MAIYDFRLTIRAVRLEASLAATWRGRSHPYPFTERERHR